MEESFTVSKMREKYGISASFFSFLKYSGYIIPTGKRAGYALSKIHNLTEDFSDDLFEGIYQEYLRYTRIKKVKPPVLSSMGVAITPKQPPKETINSLIESLKQLGAHGKVWVTKEYEF